MSDIHEKFAPETVIKRDEIDRYCDGGRDFIHDDEIRAELAANARPDAARVRDILQKSLAIQTLSGADVAAPLAVDDPDLLAEMAQAAWDVKHKVYDNRIVTFAPMYISSYCMNRCRYCGFSLDNHKEKRRCLSMDEIRREAEAMIRIGHKRVMAVYGEHPMTGARFIADSLAAIYSAEVPGRVPGSRNQVRRINVNAAPLCIDDLKIVHEAGIGTFQVFQETYDHKVYSEMHPADTVKGDFGWRVTCFHRAFDAGNLAETIDRIPVEMRPRDAPFSRSSVWHDRAVLKYAVERAAGRTPIIAGTGSNDTDYAISLTKFACDIGADAMLVVTPYYNKATQKGLIQMYTAIADASTKPLILYNVPSRTGVGIEPATYAALADHPMIAAIKEANGNISKIMETAALVGDKLDIYSGNDDQVTPILSAGGAGVISVLSNLMPRQTSEMCHRWFDGDIAGSLKMQLDYLPLINALFCEVNPIPVKAAMATMGWCENYLRLPLTPMEPEHAEKLYALMRAHGLI